MPTAKATKRLTEKQTMDLVTKVQRDRDEAAFARLTQEYLPLIQNCVKNYLARLSVEYRLIAERYLSLHIVTGNGMTVDEFLLRQGRRGLRDVIDRFPAAKGLSFKTYAAGWIMRQIMSGLQDCCSDDEVAREFFAEAISKVEAPLVSRGRVSPKAAKFVVELIRIKRKSMGFTQGEMGRQLGITRSEYGKIEAGLAKLSLHQLERIAQVLESPLTDFLSMDV